jgi:hypothetical protein
MLQTQPRGPGAAVELSDRWNLDSPMNRVHGALGVGNPS